MIRRNTNQRQIVYSALETLGHASVESLIEYILNHYDNISLATIYRNISILLEENLIKKVKLQNLNVLETLKDDHIHFVCEKCGSIVDLLWDVKPMIEECYHSQIHQINHFDVVMYGVCEKCKKEEVN